MPFCSGNRRSSYYSKLVVYILVGDSFFGFCKFETGSFTGFLAGIFLLVEDC
jgi:hypothetical protein